MLPLANTRRIWMMAFMPIIDFFSVLVGAGLVYLVRYRWFLDSDLFRNTDRLGRNDYIVSSMVFSAAVVIVFAFLGLYQVNRRLSIWNIAARIVTGIFFVLVCIIAVYFFDEFNRTLLPSGVNISRFILATGGFFILYTVLFTRFLLWLGLQILYFFNIGKLSVLLVASQKTELEKWLHGRRDIKNVYTVRELNEESKNEVEDLIRRRMIAEIYLFSNENPIEPFIAVLAERYKIPFVFRPVGFGQYSAFDLKPRVIGKHAMLEVKNTLLDGWWVVLKRLFDLVFSGVFMLVFSWLYALIAIAIKLDSKGSVFYLNERIGPDGKTFKLWKFRRFKTEFNTTDSNKDALKYEQDLIKSNNLKGDNGPLYKIKDDPRMTRVGKFLERTSLDELPQFINVLLGSMSVVGPRPHQPREVAKYKSHHYKVLNIKPGITGMAQINGRSDLSFEKEVFFDTYYIEHWSFWLDLYIIMSTPLVLIFKRHEA